MMREFRYPITILSLVSIMISGLCMSSYAGEARGVTKDTIKIGLIADLTGPAATNWLPMRDGFRNSFRYVNDQGKIHGRKIKLLVEDDRYSIPMSMAAFKKLVFRDEVLFLFGPSGSGAAYSLFSQIEKQKVPTIVASPSDSMVRPTKRYIFNCTPTYSDMVKLIVDYIVEELKAEKPRIGFVCADNEFGKAGLYPARERVKLYGLKMSEEFLEMAALDATSQVLNLKRAKTDYVIVQHAIAPAVALLRDMRKYGLEATVIATFNPCDDVVIEMAGEAARGFVAVEPFASWYDDVPGMNKMKEITVRYEPKTKMQSFWYTEGWSIPIYASEALRRAGRNLNGESFVEALESIKGLDNGGLSGPVTFGVNDHNSLDHLRFLKADIDKKRFVPITDWMKAKD